MSSTFSISVDWSSEGDLADAAADPVKQTGARIRIEVGSHVATRVEDRWSRSVREDVWLSAYPLAMWLAAAWWRLRWEPEPEAPGPDWLMSHAMWAAGHGYLWPRVTFAYDGEAIEIACRESEAVATEPIRYLEQFRKLVPPQSFERTVDGFIEMVLMRLDALNADGHELRALWNAVRQERADPQTEIHRRLEALLGRDPDEAPNTTVERLIALVPDAGEAAIAEVAPACAGSDPARSLAEIAALARAPGVEGRLPSIALSSDGFASDKPAWQRGYALAHLVRDRLDLGASHLSSQKLAEVLAIPAERLAASEGNAAPLGLAVRQGVDGRVTLQFRKKHPHARRFEAARFLADHLSAPASDHWLPATDARTWRQKLQRAFAIEMLCPFQELMEYLGGDYSLGKLEDAGVYFEVSSLAVQSHLANSGGPLERRGLSGEATGL